MQYRKFPGTDITASVLGMGCMRLPVLDTEDKPVDHPAAVRLIRKAIDSGVTYVDTAYGYHGGTSEIVVGEALRDGYREKVTLTSKLPLWKVESKDDMYRLLDEQLAKLGTDHLDFYLAHAVNGERFEKVVALGLFDFFDEMKAKGKIRYAGFSFHDNAEVFKKVVDSYSWSLVQVQMNILDEFNQATMAGVEYAASKGIGVVIMEPLRGGALTRNIPDTVLKLYSDYPVKRKPAEWAFRYLYDREEVVTILSGMSDEAVLEENLKTFESCDANCADDSEKQLFRSVREAYEARVKVGCTGCEYCQPCPMEVKIPNVLRAYDNANVFGTLDRFYANYMKERMAAKCVQCGACEEACPQHITIRKWLTTIDKEASEADK